MQIKLFVLGAALLTGLSGCGDTLGEQALIGAGAGAATAIVLDGDVLTGAIVGGAVNTIYCQQNPSKC